MAATALTGRDPFNRYSVRSCCGRNLVIPSPSFSPRPKHPNKINSLEANHSVYGTTFSS